MFRFEDEMVGTATSYPKERVARNILLKE